MDLAIARVARFYSFGHNELMTMPIEDFNNYLSCMEKITAIEMLDGIAVTSFPHSDKNSRNKTLRTLNSKLANANERKQMTLRQLAARTAGGIK